MISSTQRDTITDALRRRLDLQATIERQTERGQSFNQRIKFAVWDRRRDRPATLWGELQDDTRRRRRA